MENTDDGGYIAVGYSQSTTGDLFGLNSTNTVKGVILKVDSNGNKVWLKTYGGSKHEHFFSINKITNDGFIISGSSQSNDGDITTGNKGSSDILILKVDNNGNKIWLKTYGGSSVENSYSVQVTSDGGYVAVGSSYSSNGDITTANKGVEDFMIAKFDSQGDKVWMKTYGGSGYDEFSSVQTTSDGGYVAIGNTDSSNEDLVTGNKGLTDFVIAKFDSSGNKVWFKTYGGSNKDEFKSVQVTNDGGFVAVGRTESNNGDIIENKGSSDFVIAKFDSEGNK